MQTTKKFNSFPNEFGLDDDDDEFMKEEGDDDDDASDFDDDEDPDTIEVPGEFCLNSNVISN